MMQRALMLILLLLLAPRLAAAQSDVAGVAGAAGVADDWPVFGGNEGASHYAPFGQITRANVAQLKEAWSWQVPWPAGKPFEFEAAPLEIGGIVYVCLPGNSIAALDADTGELRWKHVPQLRHGSSGGVCRGLAYYVAPAGTPGCARRLLMAAADATLRAIDALTGEPCVGFGAHGSVDLLNGLGAVKPGTYVPTSPPTIIHGLAVLGSGVPDNGEITAPSGVVRAYDAVSGKLVWAWDLGHPDWHGEPPPGASYTRDTPNAWGIFSADESLGLVYVPTGNSNPDYYGARRSPESEKFSSSVVALDAATGEVRWSFQTVHHDLWDYDVGAQPVLVDVPGAQGNTAALVQPTKSGQLFLLDRRDGHPLAKVEERPVPQGAGRGDWTAKTQPFSTGMPSFAGPDLKEEDMWGLTPFDALWCRIQFRRARYDGPMTPPAEKPWIYSPGFMGGIDWGSVSIDQADQVMIVHAAQIANRDFFVPASYFGSQVPKDRLPFPYFRQEGSPYYAVYIALFRSPTGMPCQRPPYGVLGAVDLKTHKLLWKRPLGTSRNSGPFGLQLPISLPMGSPAIGGSVATAAGIVFLSGTLDQYLRAVDVRTGEELWRTQLPSPGFANPISYLSPKSGRQYVAIASGGISHFTKAHGLFVKAFALAPAH